MTDALAQTQQLIQDASKPIANTFGLIKLPENAHLIVASALFFWAIHIVVAPIISSSLFPVSYSKLKSRKSRNNWDSRVVSLTHALIILPLAFKNLDLPTLDADRAFGWDKQYGLTASVACGYFVWDTFESLIHFSDFGFVIHGLACFFIYFLSFGPFIGYYGPRFLLWELSTPFLNIVWFLDKMDMTGSSLQMINGILLLASFFSSRIIYGSLQSLSFYRTMLQIKDSAPLAKILTYSIGNIILNGLNVFWFSKMIASVRKRRAPPKDVTKEVKSR